MSINRLNPCFFNGPVISGLCLFMCHFLLACSAGNDTGKLCQGSSAAVSASPIGNENVVVELDVVQSSSMCETFNCVTSGGLPSYCTQTCTFNTAPSKAKTCQADSDCTAPLHCHQGICNNDNCPAGFWCKTVQNVGPLSNQQYCVRRQNCKVDLDCGDVQSFSCVNSGCYDSCLIPANNCTFPQWVCQPLSKLNCVCNNNSSSCLDNQLVCTPPGANEPWPTGSVSQEGICLPR